MFYRRNLPHWHPDLADATYLFITWRLSGSLPRCHFLPRPAAAPISPGRAFQAADREMDKAAFGPTWLRDARIAAVVANAIHHGDTNRHLYQLRSWVIMPNHVHVLLLPKSPVPQITRWLKGSTARQSNTILSRTGQPFWQPESFDHRVRNDMELHRIARYIEQNPVNAGLARSPQAWPWSSAYVEQALPPANLLPIP